MDGVTVLCKAKAISRHQTPAANQGMLPGKVGQMKEAGN
jgi:hypothetical protein